MPRPLDPGFLLDRDLRDAMRAARIELATAESVETASKAEACLRDAQQRISEALAQLASYTHPMTARAAVQTREQAAREAEEVRL